MQTGNLTTPNLANHKLAAPNLADGTLVAQNLIGGEWTSGTGDAVVSVDNPSTGLAFAQVPSCTTEDVQAAIDAAAAALPGWSRTTADGRAAVLARLAELLRRDEDRLAELMSAESGKPPREARAEINYGRGFVEWASGEATRVYGEMIPSWNGDKRIMVLRQPVGVTAAITPWNFPLAMITRKLAPALAAGCTQIIKPASQTPLTALALGELAVEAGVPAGVVNVITGSGPLVSEALFSDVRVRKVSFTGSTEVGRELIVRSAANITRLSLELGGHAPVIVFDDADIEVAVAGSIHAKFRNAGQSCIGANRFFVGRAVHDDFCEAFAKAVAALRVGPAHEDLDIGALIDAAAVAKVQEHVDDAVAKGATLRSGGHAVTGADDWSDRFYAPTLLTEVTDDMAVFTEETFGPLAGVSVFDDDDEAVERANATPYGLAAYIFTTSTARMMRVAERLECGVVGVNDGLPSSAQVPFGGVKWSGYGREGGKYVMDEYLETKYVSIGL